MPYLYLFKYYQSTANAMSNKALILSNTDRQSWDYMFVFMITNQFRMIE